MNPVGSLLSRLHTALLLAYAADNCLVGSVQHIAGVAMHRSQDSEKGFFCANFDQ